MQFFFFQEISFKNILNLLLLCVYDVAMWACSEKSTRGEVGDNSVESFCPSTSMKVPAITGHQAFETEVFTHWAIPLTNTTTDQALPKAFGSCTTTVLPTLINQNVHPIIWVNCSSEKSRRLPMATQPVNSRASFNCQLGRIWDHLGGEWQRGTSKSGWPVVMPMRDLPLSRSVLCACKSMHHVCAWSVRRGSRMLWD